MKPTATHTTLWCLLATATISLSPLACAATPTPTFYLTDEDRATLDLLDGDDDAQDLSQTWLEEAQAQDAAPGPDALDAAIASVHAPANAWATDAAIHDDVQASLLEALLTEEPFPVAITEDAVDSPTVATLAPFDEVVESVRPAPITVVVETAAVAAAVEDAQDATLLVAAAVEEAQPATAQEAAATAEPVAQPMPFDEAVEAVRAVDVDTVIDAPVAAPVAAAVEEAQPAAALEAATAAPVAQPMPFDEVVEDVRDIDADTVIDAPVAAPVAAAVEEAQPATALEAATAAPVAQPIPFEEVVEDIQAVDADPVIDTVVDAEPMTATIEEDALPLDVEEAVEVMLEPEPLTPYSGVVPDYDQQNPANLHPCDVRDEYLTDWQVENCPQPL